MQNIPFTYLYPCIFVPGIVNQITNMPIQSQNIVPASEFQNHDTYNVHQIKNLAPKNSAESRCILNVLKEKESINHSTKKVKKNKTLKHKKDQEFVQREQTYGRNLTSNTFKLYLRQIRFQNTQTFNFLEKIISLYGLKYSSKEFMATLNRYLPQKKNYISLKQIKELAGGRKVDKQFSKVFRISLRHFYLKDIYTVDIRSVRTTRQIRLHQIKKGKQFVQQLQVLSE